MDTLCIPVGLENASLRANAINKMDLIYAGARDVLVLDPELQQISLEGLPQEEISAHVLCSPWMTRCWTLQEARLSSNYYAQFADGIFDPRSAHRRLMNDLGSYTASKENFDDLGCMKYELFVEWYYRQLHKHNLSELGLTVKVNDPFHMEWDNLAQRSTTKKEDIHCILANMLGFSAGELFGLPYEERMKAILCTQTTLPLKLLFNPGPRIQDLDNRWVPSYPEGTVGNGLGYVKVTSNGLLFDHTTARCEGFLVSSSTSPPTMFCLSVLPNGASEPLWASPSDKDTGLVFEASTRIATCYILGEDIHSRSAIRDPVGRALLGHHEGARFALQRREGNILHLLYEHPVRFRYSAKEYDAYNRLKEDGSGWTLINAEKIDMNHVYHIDSGQYSPLPPMICVGLCSSGDIFSLLIASDIGSWPKLTNRDKVLEEMKAHDIENIGIYLFTAGIVVWFPFSLLSGLSIVNTGLLITLAGPLLVVLTRLVLVWAEYTRLRAVLYSQRHEMYIRTYYYHNNNNSDDIPSPGLPEEHHQTAGGGGDVGGYVGGCVGGDKLKSSVFLLVDSWQLFLAVATATALIIVGVRFATSQKWALWMGLAILTELVMRLVLEALWRKTDFGRLVPRWLARQTWWNGEYVAETIKSGP